MKLFSCLDYKNCKHYIRKGKCYPDCFDYVPTTVNWRNNMNKQETSKITLSGTGQRIFLASPYTHKDKEIMTLRYEATLLAASRLVKEGNIVFSPIVHSHPMAITYNLPKDYSFWQAQSNSYIVYWATAFSVLCLQDWEHSIGIKDELALAQDTKLPISYIHLGNTK